MSFQLAEAYVELNARGFNTVSGAIGKIKSGMGSLVGTASTVALGVTASFAGVGAAFGVLGYATIPLAAKLEQTEAQFKTLLGSSDAAKTKIEELQQFAASTPFQFDGLADSAKVLLAFGTSSEQVVPTLRVLGDVAAATGNQVGELANIYGKVKSRGALMTESLDQFNERGIPVGRMLAEMFGKTESEIREMASNGEISFADLQRAMQGMTSEGGIAFNGMAEQAGTLSGLWSTLKDNLSLIMTDIGSAMMEGFDLKESVGSMTEFVQRVRGEWMPSIVAGFRWMSDNIVKPLFSAIGSMTTFVMDFVRDFDLYWAYAYDSVVNYTSGMFDEFTSLFSGMSSTVAGWIGPFIDTIKEIGSVFFELVKNIDLYWKLAYTSLGNSLSNMYQSVATFFENSVTMGKWFYESVGTLFSNLWRNAGKLFDNYIQQLKNNWQSLLDFFKTGKLNFDFSPIADSFAAAVEGIDMPKLAKPQLDLLKSEMDAIKSEINNRNSGAASGDSSYREKQDAIERKFDEARRMRAEERRKRESVRHETKVDNLEIEGAKEKEIGDKKVDQLKKEGDAAKKNADADQKARNASFSGLSELAEKMQQSLFSKKKDNGEGGVAGIANPAKINRFTKLKENIEARKIEREKTAELARTRNMLDRRSADGMNRMELDNWRSEMQNSQQGFVSGAGSQVQAMDQKPTLEILSRMVAAQEALLTSATGSGLKIANQPGSVSVPSSSIRFGT